MDELVEGSGMDGMSPSWQDLIFCMKYFLGISECLKAKKKRPLSRE